MTDINLGPLRGRQYWFVPIAPLDPVGSICLPGSEPVDEITDDAGRTMQLPPPMCFASTVLVFESPEAASRYFVAYTHDTEWRSKNLGFDTTRFSIARMSPEQIGENFRQQHPNAIWHVPVPVYDEWVDEVVEILEEKGIPPSTEAATKRLNEFLARNAS